MLGKQDVAGILLLLYFQCFLSLLASKQEELILFNCIKPLLLSSQICDHSLCTRQAFHYVGSHYTFANIDLWCSFSADIQDSPGQGPVQPAVGDPASAGGLD